MKTDLIIKRIVDAVMYVLFVLLMGQCVLGGAVHEWLGISIGILFIIHNALNYRWYKSLFKGRYNAMRTAQLVVNILLIIAMILCMISGILISRHIFTAVSGSAIEFGRHLHLVITAWAFILMTVHLGLHLSIFSAVFKKIKADKRVKKAVHIICYALIAVICAYGVYQFTDRRFWEELFHLIDYQKEYDYTKSLLDYFAGTAAISVLFTAATHYIKKLFLKMRKSKNKLSK